MTKYNINNPDEKTDLILANYKNSGWRIWRFCDASHKNQKEHFYIVIPVSAENFLLLCLITSKIANREKYYEGSKLSDNLVKVGKTQLDCLSIESIIDCNQPLYISKDDFKKRMFGLSIVNAVIGETLKSKMLSKINASPIVKPFIKRAIISFIKDTDCEAPLP